MGLVVGLLSAIVLGVLVETLIIRRFFTAPRLVLTVATIGLAQILAGGALFLPRAFGDTNFGTRLPQPFDATWTFGGTTFNANDIFTMLVVPTCLVLLAVFLQRSTLGIAILGAAERADRASTLGIPVRRLHTVVWVVASVLAFLAMFLRAGAVGLPIGQVLTPTFLVQALAAAVFGRFERFTTIAAAAIGLGIVDQAMTFQSGNRPGQNDAVLFVIVLVGLLVTRGTGSGRVDSDSSVDLAGHQGDATHPPRDAGSARGGRRAPRPLGGHRRLRPQPPDVAVHEPARAGDHHRALRHRRRLAGGPHRLGRAGEPRPHGLRGRRRRRRRRPGRHPRVGRRHRRARRRAGRRRGRPDRRLPGPASAGAHPGGEHPRLRPVHVVVHPRSRAVRRPAAGAPHRARPGARHLARERHHHVLRRPGHAGAGDDDDPGAAAVPHRTGAHRHPRERARRPRLRRQRRPHHPRLVRAVGLPRRGRRRPLHPAAARPQRRALPPAAEPRALLHGRDRRPGLAARSPARRGVRAGRSTSSSRTSGSSSPPAPGS